jgi:hypothetical protein
VPTVDDGSPVSGTIEGALLAFLKRNEFLWLADALAKDDFTLESLLLLDSDEAVDRDFLRNSLKLSPTDGCRLIERIRIQREQSGVGWLSEASV